MKRKTRGFTLIELLAVILILGIIALIAIPTVSKIIEQSKRETFEATSNNLVRAIEDACQIQTLKGETITSIYTFSDGVASPSLDIKGKLPTIGTAEVDSNCNVKLNVTNGEYTATKMSTEDSVTVLDDAAITYTVYNNGTEVYFNPIDGKVCTKGETVSTIGTKMGCMKWYAFNDGGASSNTINLILDHNTTALVAWNSTGSNASGPTNVLTQLKTDTSSWLGVPTRTDSYSIGNGKATYAINYNGYRARLMTASEIAVITGNSSFADATAIYSDWFYLDSNNQIQKANINVPSIYYWLFDYTIDCTNYGCKIADSSNCGYWTSTAISGSTYYAWTINRNGNLDGRHVESIETRGVRPVITILKSSL